MPHWPQHYFWNWFHHIQKHFLAKYEWNKVIVNVVGAGFELLNSPLRPTLKVSIIFPIAFWIILRALALALLHIQDIASRSTTHCSGGFITTYKKLKDFCGYFVSKASESLDKNTDDSMGNVFFISINIRWKLIHGLSPPLRFSALCTATAAIFQDILCFICFSVSQ